MSSLAQDLLKPREERSEVENMENTALKIAVSDGRPISEDVKVSSALIHTAQKTLCDLDRSILELAVLVEGLRKQSKQLTIETL